MLFFLTAPQFWHHLLNKIFWQNKMLFRPTIPSFFFSLKPETHIYFFLALELRRWVTTVSMRVCNDYSMLDCNDSIGLILIIYISELEGRNLNTHHTFCCFNLNPIFKTKLRSSCQILKLNLPRYEHIYTQLSTLTCIFIYRDCLHTSQLTQRQVLQ